MLFTIYYYSNTGNSLHAAKKLAEKLPECRLVSMTSNSQKPVADTEGIGFVFPTHYFGAPPVVLEFIKKLKLQQAKYVFAVASCGFRHINSSLNQVDKVLKEKNSKLDAGFHLEMVSSYIPLSDIPPADKTEKRLADADKKIADIANTISSKEKKVSAEFLRLLSRVINKYWLKNLLSKAPKKFSVSQACTSCGICKKVCPTDNIFMESGKPKWGKDCQECLACLHFCPDKCIEFGKKTIGRKRYHHPKVSVGEIIASRNKL
ncbi:EFR1 family ferrodoxin [Dendrosporobacter sp. 1207_IL3150]|uniref:EFR1 family ferrodoxin n=1 Tax=Dendrosporobacter sp. 1207_IL3150 TaxID=3084054 RepID=UPI002FD9CFC0